MEIEKELQEAERQCIEAERQKALLPEKEKLLAWMTDIFNVADAVPTLKDKNMKAITHRAKEELDDLLDYLRGQLT